MSILRPSMQTKSTESVVSGSTMDQSNLSSHDSTNTDRGWLESWKEAIAGMTGACCHGGMGPCMDGCGNESLIDTMTTESEEIEEMPQVKKFARVTYRKGMWRNLPKADSSMLSKRDEINSSLLVSERAKRCKRVTYKKGMWKDKTTTSIGLRNQGGSRGYFSDISKTFSEGKENAALSSQSNNGEGTETKGFGGSNNQKIKWSRLTRESKRSQLNYDAGHGKQPAKLPQSTSSTSGLLGTGSNAANITSNNVTAASDKDGKGTDQGHQDCAVPKHIKRKQSRFWPRSAGNKSNVAKGKKLGNVGTNEESGEIPSKSVSILGGYDEEITIVEEGNDYATKADNGDINLDRVTEHAKDGAIGSGMEMKHGLAAMGAIGLAAGLTGNLTNDDEIPNHVDIGDDAHIDKHASDVQRMPNDELTEKRDEQADERNDDLGTKASGREGKESSMARDADEIEPNMKANNLSTHGKDRFLPKYIFDEDQDEMVDKEFRTPYRIDGAKFKTEPTADEVEVSFDGFYDIVSMPLLKSNK